MTNWGILGTGNIAKTFASAIKETERSNLLAVGSRSKGSADLFASTYNCIGFDKAPSMVEEAKSNLKSNGLSEDLINEGDFETFVPPKKFDCILGMGSFYYAKDPIKTISRMASFLEDEGSMIFSLRNKLFDLVTLNRYTASILKELYISETNTVLAREFDKLLEKKLLIVKNCSIKLYLREKLLW